MPIQRELTPDELQEIASSGQDPKLFSGPQTVYSPEEMQSMQPKTSAVAAGARSAGASVVPTVGGGIGAGMGMGAASGAELGPLGIIGGGIIGSIIGGYGAAKAQAAVMPDVWKQQLADDAKAHPTATTLGSLSTLPLGGFSPNIGNLSKAARGLGDLIAPEASSLVNKQALVNSAVSAGIGGVQEAGQEKLEGEDLSASKILEQAGIGALFNERNKFGEGYNRVNGLVGLQPGFHATGTDPLQDAFNNQQGNDASLTGVKVPDTTDKSAPDESAISKPDVTSSPTGIPLTEGLTTGKITGGPSGRAPVGKDEDGNYIYKKLLTVAPQLDKELPTMPAELSHATAEGMPEAPEEQLARHQAAYRMGQDDFAQWAAENLDKMAGKDPSDYWGNVQVMKPAFEAAAKEGKMKLSDEQEGLRAQVPALDDAVDALKDVNIHTGITEPMFNAWQAKAQAQHGIPMTTGDTGSAKGTYDPSNRQITIGGNATQDTPAHEISHDVWANMPERLRGIYSQRVAEKVADYNKKADAWNSTNADKPMRHIDAEEYFAMQTGLKTITRLVANDDSFKSWWNDLKARYKHQRGGGTDADSELFGVQAVLNGQVKMPVSGAGASKNTEDIETLHNAGAEQYYKERIKPQLDEQNTAATEKMSPDDRNKFANWFRQLHESVSKASKEGEGLTSKEKKAAYDQVEIARRAELNKHIREQYLAANPDSTAREAGKAPTTYPHDPTYPVPVSGRVERTPYSLGDTDTKDYSSGFAKEKLAKLDSSIYRAIGRNIRQMKVRNAEGKKELGFIKKDDAESIKNEVRADIMKNGLDVEKGFSPEQLLERSVNRRTNDAIGKWMKESGQSGEQQHKVTSLDKSQSQETGEVTQHESIGENEHKEEPESIDTVGDLLDKFGHTDTPLGNKILDHLEEQIEKGKLTRESPADLQSLVKKFAPKMSGEKEGLEQPSENKKAYNKAQEDMRKHEFGSPEHTEAWKRLEVEKNKNGGMPPLKSDKEEGLRSQVNFMMVKPELDVARDKTGKEGAPAANAIQDFYALKPQLRAAFSERTLKQSSGMSKDDITKVHNTLQREMQDKTFYRSELRTDKQRSLYDAARKDLRAKQDYAIANEMTVRDKGVDRVAKIDPFYYPGVLKHDVIQQIAEKGPQYQTIKKDFLDYWQSKKYTPEQALERWKSLVSIASPHESNKTRFSGARLAEGVGIPMKYTEPSMQKTFAKYSNRVATDFAWRKNVEMNPEVASKLEEGSEERLPQFYKVVEKIKGEPFDKDSSLIKALARVATSVVLGPMTNVHIGWSSMFNPMQYLKGSELASAYSNAIANLSKANTHALENGYLQRDSSLFSDVLDKSLNTTERLNAMAAAIGKINGRQFTDTFSKTFAQSLSEQIVPLRLASAKAGDKSAQKLIRQLDSSWTPEKKYTPQEQTVLASTLAGYIHGSHDARTLPSLLTGESWAKPFLSLMSWSTAQTNQWMKHVWEPATRGDLQPLLMSALGATVGGYAIQQLRQMVADKKSNIPSLTEIANSKPGLEGNIPLLAYNFMQMASFTGFAGLGSVTAKDVFDMAYKNIPQGSAFPLDEVIDNTAGTISEAVSAWMQTPNSEAFFNIFPKMMTDLAKDNVQSARIASNWLADKGLNTDNENYKYEVSTQESNLRRYKMANGMPTDQQTEPNNNPYLNIPQKEFKRTTDLGTAMSDLPGLIQQAQQRAHGNPEIFQQQLQSLKQNSYQTMPSLEHAPMQFSNYYNYLIATQGKEKADVIMQSYMQHNNINKIKSGMVP